MPTTPALGGEITVTQRLLTSAAGRGQHLALTGGPAAYSYADLAQAVQRAAAGLAWRGLRPRDVVGVYVADAAAYVLACHSIRAAGGIPSPINSGRSVTEIAGQLADCGARMLLTSQPLAAAGLAAADRSWVRQVISFGEAAGAMPFTSLLGVGTLPPSGVRPNDLALLPYTRRPDGELRPTGLSHADMTAELIRLSAEAAISDRDVVLAAPPAGDGRSYAICLDHALLHGSTIVATGTSDLAAAAAEHHAAAVIVPAGYEVAGPERMLVFAVAS